MCACCLVALPPPLDNAAHPNGWLLQVLEELQTRQASFLSAEQDRTHMITR